MVEAWCGVDGCGKPAERDVEGVGPLCPKHRQRLKRLRRGISTVPLEAPALGELSPLEEAIIAADQLLDASAEDDREYADRLGQFRAAAVRWVHTMKSRRRRRRAATNAGGGPVEAAPAPSSPVPAAHPPGGLLPLPPRHPGARKPRAISALDR